MGLLPIPAPKLTQTHPKSMAKALWCLLTSGLNMIYKQVEHNTKMPLLSRWQLPVLPSFFRKRLSIRTQRKSNP